ncbi:Zinc transporter ZupT [Paraconexibacter sp. AEG42_29]|uniref:Zinc transporter ZupT n=1 Tax=Paraconexibacter sp. AEG42_29 TaxID=2997339 RepID=A0AAU7AU04_9ACTN
MSTADATDDWGAGGTGRGVERKADPGPGSGGAGGLPVWVLGLLPLLLVIVTIGGFVALDGPGIGDRTGPPAEELVVEQTVLKPGTIELTVRNDGPDAVRIAQVQVNDAYAQFTGPSEGVGRLATAKVRVQQPWVEGEAYEVVLLTSTGGTIVHPIDIAVETPDEDGSFFGLMALLGIYVGVIPVALGMLWLPWIRRIPAGVFRVVMAVTVGLLAFLAIDSTLEGLELATLGSQAFGGTALVWIGAVVAYLLLSGVSSWLSGRRRSAEASGASPTQLATLVAVGIGLHNMGEGVAIGSAYSSGALALGAFLVVGFAIHNTTEGLAIVAPIAHTKPSLGRLALLGLLAGGPAVLGAWIGAAAFNTSVAAFLFGFGAGAIVQVIVQLAPTIRDGEGRTLHPPAVAGLLAGMGIMFVTGLLVAG